MSIQLSLQMPGVPFANQQSGKRSGINEHHSESGEGDNCIPMYDQKILQHETTTVSKHTTYTCLTIQGSNTIGIFPNANQLVSIDGPG